MNSMHIFRSSALCGAATLLATSGATAQVDDGSFYDDGLESDRRPRPRVEPVVTERVEPVGRRHGVSDPVAIELDPDRLRGLLAVGIAYAPIIEDTESDLSYENGLGTFTRIGYEKPSEKVSFQTFGEFRILSAELEDRSDVDLTMLSASLNGAIAPRGRRSGLYGGLGLGVSSVTVTIEDVALFDSPNFDLDDTAIGPLLRGFVGGQVHLGNNFAINLGGDIEASFLTFEDAAGDTDLQTFIAFGLTLQVEYTF
jgi:hypothetical protein